MIATETLRLQQKVDGYNTRFVIAAAGLGIQLKDCDFNAKRFVNPRERCVIAREGFMIRREVFSSQGKLGD